MKKISYLKYYYITDEGKVYSDFTGKLKELKCRVNNNGYLDIKLKGKTYRVHRLVAEMYIDNPDNKPQVNHIDGNKLNNHYTNLEWVTNQENQLHAYIIGLNKPKEPINRVLTEELANSIRNDYVIKKLSHRELSKIYNVSKTTISDLLRGKYYNINNTEGNICRDKYTKKLSMEDATNIREYYKCNKVSYRELGRKYNVDHSVIRNIILNKTYI